MENKSVLSRIYCGGWHALPPEMLRAVKAVDWRRIWRKVYGVGSGRIGNDAANVQEIVAAQLRDRKGGG